jgi:hypothetical protein
MILIEFLIFIGGMGIWGYVSGRIYKVYLRNSNCKKAVAYVLQKLKISNLIKIYARLMIGKPLKIFELYITILSILHIFKHLWLCRPDPTPFLAHGKAHKTSTQSQPCKEPKMPTHSHPS